jgi:RNA polymerase sigma-70 factor, ECF subfamily
VNDEQVLIDRAVRGEPDALNTLAATYRPIVYRIAVGILGDPDAAEDVAQDALLRLHAALPGLPSNAELKPWVYRVSVNLCRDQLRRRVRQSRNLTIDAAVHRADLATVERPDQTVDAERARAAVAEAMNRLSDEHREVLILRYVVGLPYAEIARSLSTAQGTVASRVFRALRRLGEELDPRHQEILQ